MKMFFFFVVTVEILALIYICGSLKSFVLVISFSVSCLFIVYLKWRQTLQYTTIHKQTHKEKSWREFRKNAFRAASDFACATFLFSALFLSFSCRACLRCALILLWYHSTLDDCYTTFTCINNCKEHSPTVQPQRPNEATFVLSSLHWT